MTMQNILLDDESHSGSDSEPESPHVLHATPMPKVASTTPASSVFWKLVQTAQLLVTAGLLVAVIRVHQGDDANDQPSVVPVQASQVEDQAKLWSSSRVLEVWGEDLHTLDGVSSKACETMCHDATNCAGFTWWLQDGETYCRGVSKINFVAATQFKQVLTSYKLAEWTEVAIDAECQLRNSPIVYESGELTDGPRRFRGGVDCELTVEVPESVWTENSGIMLRFSQLQIPGSNYDKRCTWGTYVQISGETKDYGRWCKPYDDEKLPEFILTERTFRFRFYTTTAGDGFRFTWKHDANGYWRHAVTKLRGSVATVARNSIMQQVTIEQRVREEGSSGVVRTRGLGRGTEAYYTTSWAWNGAGFLHDHPNHKFTCGMGEISAVLNGVEFWTRHNDYALRKPAKNNKRYHATEYLDFPEVPPAVTEAGEALGPDSTIEERVAAEIEEMRLWFKAWQDQDFSVRDYRDYFKPVLTYLEGAWITDTGAFVEPFLSDRHVVEAETWDQLQGAMRWSLASGYKNQAENLPFLPSMINGFEGVDKDEPQVANWEYRIMTMPLKDDVPLSRFRSKEDDLHVRFFRGKASRHYDFKKTRYTRFDVNPQTESVDPKYWPTGAFRYEFLDVMMSQVPGKDNEGAKHLSEKQCEYGPVFKEGRCEPLNEGYYSRFFATLDTDANGLSGKQRGFNDPFIWAARSEQHKVAEIRNGRDSARWSYAIPMEVFFLTPLMSWNPYNLTDHGPNRNAPRRVKTEYGCTEHGGAKYKGDPTSFKAFCRSFDGTSDYDFFRVPTEFFSAAPGNEAADTGSGAFQVMDPTGAIRLVKSGGMRVILPAIPGLGLVRLRYPIFPIHEETSTAWKELKALQDVLETRKKLDTFEFEKGGTTLLLTTSNGHSHLLELNPRHVKNLQLGNTVTMNSEESGRHSHVVSFHLPRGEQQIRLFPTSELQCHPSCGTKVVTQEFCLLDSKQPTRILYRSGGTLMENADRQTYALYRFTIDENIMRFSDGLIMKVPLRLEDKEWGEAQTEVYSVGDQALCDSLDFPTLNFANTVGANGVFDNHFRRVVGVMETPTVLSKPGWGLLTVDINMDVTVQNNVCLLLRTVPRTKIIPYSSTFETSLAYHCGFPRGCDAHELTDDYFS